MQGLLKHSELPVIDWRSDDPSAANRIEISDIEYTDTDRVYIKVNDLFDVRIIRTDEGIVIDVFPEEFDGSIATTYVYDNEVIGDD